MYLPDHAVDAWRSACTQLGLRPRLRKRVQGLDHFLDEVEALLDELAGSTAGNVDKYINYICHCEER